MNNFIELNRIILEKDINFNIYSYKDIKTIFKFY